MTGPVDDEKELARNRRTLLLLVGGAASLLVPLLGVAYMHWKDIRSAVPAVAPSAAVFEHRGADGSGSAVTPAATPAPDVPANLAQVPVLPPRQGSPAPQQVNNSIDPGGSLGFVRASEDYKHQQAAAPAQAPAAPQPPAQPPQPAQKPPAQRQVAQASVGSLPARNAKPAPKPFVMPHLKTGGFGGGQQMGGGFNKGGMKGGLGGMQGGMGGMPGGGAGPLPGGMDPAQAMAAMKQMQGQGGAGMPNMGAMMQQMQQAGGAGGAPNMGAMMQQMQNMQQGGAGAGAGGQAPNMGQMMQQMQQLQGQQQQQ